MEFDIYGKIGTVSLQQQNNDIKKYVYIVLVDDCYDYETAITIEVFKDYKDALDFYNKILTKFKQDNNSPQYDTVDEGESFYYGYDEGWYNRDHYRIDVIRKELK